MPVEANDAFTLILEPVQRCNLRCLYCYSDEAGAGVMSRQTLQTALEKTARYAERQGFREIHILWHGGEPLLAGLGFFRAAMKMLRGLASECGLGYLTARSESPFRVSLSGEKRGSA